MLLILRLHASFPLCWRKLVCSAWSLKETWLPERLKAICLIQSQKYQLNPNIQKKKEKKKNYLKKYEFYSGCFRCPAALQSLDQEQSCSSELLPPRRRTLRAQIRPEEPHLSNFLWFTSLRSDLTCMRT